MDWHQHAMTAAADNDDMRRSKSVFSHPLCRPGDAVESFAPTTSAESGDEALRSAFVIAQYELVTANHRCGALQFGRVGDLNGSLSVALWPAIDTPVGLLDVKVVRSAERNVRLFAVASDGNCHCWDINLEAAPGSKESSIIDNHHVFGTEENASVFGLALDAPQRHDALYWSRSNGFICSSTLSNERCLTTIWDAHCGSEIWALAAVDDLSSSPTTLASGADDAVLKLWDLRAYTKTPIAENRTTHEAGVTAIYKPDRPFCFYSGSYDGKVRSWDTRSLLKPVAEVFLGQDAGIWRIKGIPNSDSLLVAASYGGAQLIQLNNSEGRDLQVVVSNTKDHESMVYGIAHLSGLNSSIDNLQSEVQTTFEMQSRPSVVYRGPHLNPEENLAVSCSFYDKKAAFWSF